MSISLLSCSTEIKIRCPDIFVIDRVVALKLLRNFGHLMKDLHISMLLFYYPELCRLVESYLFEYCTESVNRLTVTDNFISFENIQKPLKNVKTLHMEEITFRRELPFNKNFPNLQSLKLGRNTYWNPSSIRVHFPMLTHLAFYDRMMHSTCSRFQEEDIELLLKMNPQLEKLELVLDHKYSAELIQRMHENLPRLQELKLYYTTRMQMAMASSKPIHFENVVKLNISCNERIDIPFTFNKLKFFELITTIDSARELVELVKFIDKNKHLKSIKLIFFGLDDFPNFLELENILKYIEKLSIVLRFCCIPYDRLMRFLTRNWSLKKFSLFLKPSDFHQIVNEITSGNGEFKIRKNTLVFTVRRVTDNSTMKYIIRYTTRKWPPRNKEIGFIECCSYDESQLQNTQRYDEFVNDILALGTICIYNACEISPTFGMLKHRNPIHN